MHALESLDLRLWYSVFLPDSRMVETVGRWVAAPRLKRFELLAVTGYRSLRRESIDKILSLVDPSCSAEFLLSRRGDVRSTHQYFTNRIAAGS